MLCHHRLTSKTPDISQNYLKQKPTVETSTFGADFHAMKLSAELTESLQHKFYMFGIPIERLSSAFCNNEAVCKNNALPKSTFNKKNHAITPEMQGRCCI